MKKILIIEDDLDIIDILDFILTEAGYQTLMARNGQEGLRLALSGHPDLIITDVLMPVMDGYSLYKHLKADARTAATPVIILTARRHMKDAFTVMGADAFMSKPFADYDLLEKVRILLEKTKDSPYHFSIKRIFVAGAYAEISRAITRLLETEGLVAVSNKRDGTAFQDCVAFKPELVLVSTQLGEPGDSLFLIHRLRGDEGLGKVPILVYSYFHADTLGSEAQYARDIQIDTGPRDCLEAGADAYLGHFQPHTFLSVLRPYLSRISSV